MQENTISSKNPSPSWMQLLAGVLPFVIFGPVMILLTYPYPYPDYRQETWWKVLMPTVYILPILLGLVIGAIRRFPAWAYPYAGVLLSFLALAFSMIVLPIAFQNNQELYWSLWFQIPVAAVMVWLVSALVLLLARFVRFLYPLYVAVRRDWTRLSFALCMIPTIFSSMIDHEEEPVLTLSMFLSTVCLVLGALAYLLSRTHRQRLLSLLVGLGLAVIFRTLDGEFVMAAYMLWGALVALTPSLLGLLPRSKEIVSESI